MLCFGRGRWAGLAIVTGLGIPTGFELVLYGVGDKTNGILWVDETNFDSA